MRLLAAVLLAAAVPARADEALARFAVELKALSPDGACEPAPQPKGVIIRFPSWELGAARNAEMAAGPGVPLPEADIAFARTVFGDSVDYAAVRMAVAEDDLAGFAQTWGDTIRVPPGGISRSTLMHELVHVWQYQTGGLGYISDSLGAQVCSFVTELDRNGAYRYQADPGKSFFDYSAEQQAKIVEHYVLYPKKRATEHYQRWLRELRSRKFVPGDRATLFEENAAGLMPWRYEPPALSGFEPDRVMPGVPQLEARF